MFLGLLKLIFFFTELSLKRHKSGSIRAFSVTTASKWIKQGLTESNIFLWVNKTFNRPLPSPHSYLPPPYLQNRFITITKGLSNLTYGEFYVNFNSLRCWIGWKRWYMILYSMNHSELRLSCVLASRSAMSAFWAGCLASGGFSAVVVRLYGHVYKQYECNFSLQEPPGNFIT